LDYDSQVAEIIPGKLEALRKLPEIEKELPNNNGTTQPRADDNDFSARGQRMAELAQARGDVEEPRPIQLPIWAEPQRVTPTATLRSALFSCARRRKYVEDALIASWRNTKVKFTGQTLNQFDEAVWMQLVHMFRQQGEPEDFKVRFNAKPFLRSLGKAGKGGGGSAVLRESLVRLRGGTIQIHIADGSEHGGGILEEYTIHVARGHFVVTLNPKFVRLLETNHTRIGWEQRKLLPTGLATWMHRYILSHKATTKHPHRIGLTKLHPLTGMSSPLKEFKRHLKRTMALLEKHRIVDSWRITPNGSLELTRPCKVLP